MFFMTFLAELNEEERDTAEKLFVEHKQGLFSYTMSIIHNPDDSYDIVLDTFYKVQRNIQKFMTTPSHELVPLLIIYTKNTIRDFLRKQKRNSKVIPLVTEYEDDIEKVLEIADNNPLPEKIVIDKEFLEYVAACIDSLPPSQREVAILKFKYHYRDKEIVEILGISETAVSTRINRARNTLREKIGGVLNDQSDDN